MRVVIAEKPSVARDLARVLGAKSRRNGYLEGNGLQITWCFGHLCELVDPETYNPQWKRWRLEALPMLVEQFQTRVRPSASDQFQVIARLLAEADSVVNACDAGREGELIFRHVFDSAHCSAPVYRLWISSLTDSAISTGWKNLQPGAHYDALSDAAHCRSEADWLVGLNATRAMTCRAREFGGDLLSIGRVQTPTLAIIVERDLKIKAFVPETFWQVQVPIVGEFEPFLSMWVRKMRPSGKELEQAQRLNKEEHAKAIVDALFEQKATVVIADRRRTVERPPLLHDLTSLQQKANRRYGLSAKRTLEIAQVLYEKHKLITYPRTDARFLTPDQVPTLPGVLKGLLGVSAYSSFCSVLLNEPLRTKRIVNAAEVGDHHALLPTGRNPLSCSLSSEEKRVFDLIARRLVSALYPDALFDQSLLVFEVVASVKPPLSSPLFLRANGKVCRQKGWHEVEPPKKSKEVSLPGIERGDRVALGPAKIKEGQTRAPKPMTDASILGAMERPGNTVTDKQIKRALRSQGLGTPATRASILQTLFDRGYTLRQGKQILSTEKGRALITSLPVTELRSPVLTGQWEGRLAAMAEGKEQRSRFMADVRQYTQSVVDAIRGAPMNDALFISDKPKGAVIGECPACGKPVRDQGRVFACDGGRSCAFVVFKTMSKRKISTRLVKQLLKEGRSAVVKGFKSKAGKPFEAALVWQEDQQRVGFGFAERVRVGDRCPRCKVGTIIRGRTALGCDRWREGCTFRT